MRYGIFCRVLLKFIINYASALFYPRLKFSTSHQIIFIKIHIYSVIVIFNNIFGQIITNLTGFSFKFALYGIRIVKLCSQNYLNINYILKFKKSYIFYHFFINSIIYQEKSKNFIKQAPFYIQIEH